MYNFTNEEFKRLCDSIEQNNKVEQLFILSMIQMKKSIENKKIRDRVNEKRKTNKYYGRPKSKEA